jgi:hypothetical protein
VDLISLTYVSAARLPLSAQELQHIHAHSQRSNRQRDITGALGFTGRYFVQCIEGRRGEVEALIRRIESDARHSRVLLLDSETVTNRRFGEWSMAYVDSLALDEEVACAYRAGIPSKQVAQVLLQKMAAALRPGESLHSLR